jgi:2-desacetyl-2-hydroxyethyl bacteriochlorophyllide A dehydrogenase
MKTISLQEPGRFEIIDTPAPEVRSGEVRVRVHRVGVCGTDLHAYAGRQPFFTYPRVLGHELGVEVLEVSGSDTGLRVGDSCSVEPYLNCGTCWACGQGKTNCCETLAVLGIHTDGGMCPEIVVPASKLHASQTLSIDQLALVETLGIGAHAVERAALTEADRVLVIGAGPIGLSVLQFAMTTRATVGVMDVSERRLGFVRETLGIDRTAEPGDDAIRGAQSCFDGEAPTVVIDATGNPRSMAGAFALPVNGGRIVFVGLFQGDVTFNDPNFHRRELTLAASRNAPSATFGAIITAIEAGRIDTSPWITHRMNFDDVPADFATVARDAALFKAMITI